MSDSAPLPIDTFLPYMRELNLMWRMIEASAKMHCPVEAKTILPTMAATRAGFNRLEQELVSSLVTEKVGNVLDIVVRNLYERTADVGFLTTDRGRARAAKRRALADAPLADSVHREVEVLVMQVTMGIKQSVFLHLRQFSLDRLKMTAAGMFPARRSNDEALRG